MPDQHCQRANLMWRHAATAVLLALLSGSVAAQVESIEITSDVTIDSDDALQRELDELRLRVQGMDGKLKDSAAARKSADQARMEIERRLAESTQETEQLRQTLLEREGDVARLSDELIAARQAHVELAEHLAAAQAQIPTADGGHLTAEMARQAATEALAVFNAARQAADGAADPALAQALTEAETALRRQQFSVAQTIDAQGVYRVRASDSLALIAGRIYGSSTHWQALFDANQHVLADPDQLAPGLTLVLP